MSEDPTATPEPVPWGDETDPFPEGTVISRRAPTEAPTERIEQAVETEWNGAQRIVYIDGIGFSHEEIQGRLNQRDWEIVDREGEQ